MSTLWGEIGSGPARDILAASPAVDNTGGLAFESLTMRDFFAAFVLQGMYASGANRGGDYLNRLSTKALAHEAYTMADAMLLTRSGKEAA